MKRLQSAILIAGIFALTGFGVSEWQNVIKKAYTSGMILNITRMWNQSLYDTGNEWNDICHNRIPGETKRLPINPSATPSMKVYHTDADFTEMSDDDQ